MKYLWDGLQAQKKKSYSEQITFQKFEKIACSPKINCQTLDLLKQFILILCVNNGNIKKNCPVDF